MGRGSPRSVGGSTGNNRNICVSGRLGIGRNISRKRKIREQALSVENNGDASQLMGPQAPDEEKEEAIDDQPRNRQPPPQW